LRLKHNRFEDIAIENRRLIGRLPDKEKSFVLRVYGKQETVLDDWEPSKVRLRAFGLIPITGQQQVDHLFPCQRVNGLGVDLFSLQFHEAEAARKRVALTGGPVTRENTPHSLRSECFSVVIAL